MDSPPFFLFHSGFIIKMSYPELCCSGWTRRVAFSGRCVLGIALSRHFSPLFLDAGLHRQGAAFKRLISLCWGYGSTKVESLCSSVCTQHSVNSGGGAPQTKPAAPHLEYNGFNSAPPNNLEPRTSSHHQFHYFINYQSFTRAARFSGD